ncbi:hypothetical protein CERZMDRAFT_100126 [Cercospora zeae-maydis SCOH1-5]|uniref:F-box domain-containing protein n=1 Tax=Cercospora zeae-maydis SCOH1-5 TaxID=717836 RepID=A0A6A6F868_9PEZI|nr:hypothetical protein CERZMDRAFT_100126 [Cercospora zeae-maydis SCOH1-5]
MATSDGLTPLKIRGKRRGAPSEKWNSGKRRKPELQRRRTSLDITRADATRSTKLRLRTTRQSDDDSPLETLPAEVLQQIFEYSGNVDLAVVSRQLAAKLSKSHHLQNELATRLLEPVLHSAGGSEPSAAELQAATRLLDSRFMTWQFFTAWLCRQTNVASTDKSIEDINCNALWNALRPDPALLPPRKLFLTPFTTEKVSFLSLLLQGVNDIAFLDLSYAEIAYEGLVAAIQADVPDLVFLFLGVGLNSDTELLRIAVEAGCNQEIVQMLVDSDAAKQRAAGRSKGEIDLLDQAIWAWAEHARKQGNDRGTWLISYLQARQRENVPSR